jgi:hypothetical protein
VLYDLVRYTPPFNVRAITKDLALLPAWYADEGDYVFIDEPAPEAFSGYLPAEVRLSAIPITRDEVKEKSQSLPPMEAAPWGLSRQSVNLFGELKQYGLDLDIPVLKDGYAALTGRFTAAACLEEIRRALPGMDIPEPPVFFSQMEEIEAYLHKSRAPLVLKTPYSSSGRGLLWLTEGRLSDSDRNRIRGMLRDQNTVSMEYALNKEADFALEYYSDGKGKLYERGLSLFSTGSRGAYKGNILQPQSAIMDKLMAYAGEDAVNSVRQTVYDVLCDTLGSKYTGYLGVDMLVYKGEKGFGIHPCVEINLRHTMGMVAISLSERFLDKSSTGMFNISYEKNPLKACEEHLRMKKAYPPTFVNGKLQRGYLSLCPVTEETHYTAYILAEAANFP